MPPRSITPGASRPNRSDGARPSDQHAVLASPGHRPNGNDRHAPSAPETAEERAKRAAAMARLRAEAVWARRDAAIAPEAELRRKYRPRAERMTPADERAAWAAESAIAIQAGPAKALGRSAAAHAEAALAHARAGELARLHGGGLRVEWHRNPDGSAR